MGHRSRAIQRAIQRVIQRAIKRATQDLSKKQMSAQMMSVSQNRPSHSIGHRSSMLRPAEPTSIQISHPSAPSRHAKGGKDSQACLLSSEPPLHKELQSFDRLLYKDAIQPSQHRTCPSSPNPPYHRHLPRTVSPLRRARRTAMASCQHSLPRSLNPHHEQ